MKPNALLIATLAAVLVQGCSKEDATSALVSGPSEPAAPPVDESVAAVKRLAAAEKEKADYIAQHLQLYSIRAAYFKTEAADRVPGVQFKIRNTGQRTVKTIEVTAVFRDAASIIIDEEKFYPLAPGSPLKPGFIYQIPQDGFFSCPRVASEWKEGATGVKITDIDFEP